ncbi:agmatinase [Candidatus Micrarchaeota archaeon RBG_16_49_10]|nr:MAG: agmatinase [Candidatus Micrarchaeota archaeon RBG_16_49_10]
MIFMESYSSYRFPASAKSEKEADLVVFGVPFDSTVDYMPGARFGCRAVREATNFIEPFDLKTGKNILEKTKIFDAGDLAPNRGDSKETVEIVRRYVEGLLKKGKFPLMIGGEHLISLGAVKTLPKGTKIVSFDAHYDLKEVWEGSEYTHNTWLRRAAEIVGPQNICIIGVRAGDEFEHEFAKKILVNPSKEQLKKFCKGNIYLSIDMDVFDISIAPGVGTPEPDGMLFREFDELLKIVCKGKVIGMDLVEARPLGDDKITEILGAKTIFRALNYIFC